MVYEVPFDALDVTSDLSDFAPDIKLRGSAFAPFEKGHDCRRTMIA
jgi:hypothetical protein